MNIENKLGFDKIISFLDKYLNEIGRTQLENIKFSTDIDQINFQLSTVSEFIEILENHNFPLENYFDLRPALNKIQIKGTYLSAEELLDLWLSLDTLKRIQNFFKQRDLAKKFQFLKKLVAGIKIYPFLFDLMKQTINRKAEILDSASKQLKQIRDQLQSKQLELNRTVNQIFKQAKAAGIVEKDASLVVRGGKILIPVPASKKNRIQGLVQDTSATGKTVFIEPFKAVELSNELTELRLAEKREIIRILTEVADKIRPYIPDLMSNYDILAELDFIRAKANLAQELDAEKPQLIDKPVIDLHKARHPLLVINYKNTNRQVVPLNLRLDQDQRIVLISGPNAGGKSVALKTVGLLQYMIQTGFLVPARFTSTFGIFDKIFVDIGDDQSIENDLSTYTSRLLNLKNILQNATDRSLVLIDEFGSGTDPVYGGAIAEAILEKLLKMNVRAVITTHYSNLKHFAAQHQGIVNAAMIFDSKNLKPLYKLETGRPGSSFALEIATNIGLPKDIIQRSKQIIGKNQLDFDKIIRQIEHQLQQITKERDELAQVKQQLKEKVIAYRQEYEKILRQKQQIIQQANQQADQILSQANKLIENTIRQIKEHQAERTVTRQIRKEFDRNRQQLNQRRQQLQKTIEKQLIDNLKKQNKLKTSTPDQINEGDYVVHKKSGLKGKVQSIKDNNVLLIAGSLKTMVKLTDLEKLPADEARQLKRQEKKGGVNIQMSAPQQFISALDVRGLRSEEALQKVIKFLDAAIVANAREIRILHGTGDGILRKNIRAYLKNVEQVEWFGDADPRFGGPGITVVKLK